MAGFTACAMDGSWITVGTPDAIPRAEAAVAKARAQPDGMTQREDSARVFSIPPGAPFLPTLAKSMKSGRLVPGFDLAADPLAMARAPRSMCRHAGPRASCARAGRQRRRPARPSCRPSRRWESSTKVKRPSMPNSAALLDLAPPIADLDRLLLLAPVVAAWKRRFPRACREAVRRRSRRPRLDGQLLVAGRAISRD